MQKQGDIVTLHEVEDILVDVELYFYGEIIYSGEKNKSIFHLNTEQYGVLVFDIPKDFSDKHQELFLNERVGVRATAKQNLISGELDKNSLMFLELIEYNTEYDESYLNSLVEEAKKTWVGKISSDEFLNEVREGV